MKPILYGLDDSVYVRIVRLALEEKGVGYDLLPVDVFAEAGPPVDYLERHPFGRIPALEHDGFCLYESGAIVRYVDERFDGPLLQPQDVKQRARMNQIVSIADSYVYRALVWDVYVERKNKPSRGEVADEAKIAAALIKARHCFASIIPLMHGTWMSSDMPTLSDLYLAAMLDYFLMTEEGRSVLSDFPQLLIWWSAMVERPSMLATKYPTY